MKAARFVIIFIVLGGVVYLAASYLFRPSLVFNGKANLRIGEMTFKLDVADTDQKRETGLSGRERMADDEGMIFLFGHSVLWPIWMKGMNFPIDIVWLNANKVIDIKRNTPPEDVPVPVSYYPVSEADAVIELNAGMADKAGIRLGDRIYW
ncbi:MAG: DUF192 domain-containing protein [Parcubacteria group bacterium]|nr:DUF192 domain-containing protein [Parcubacteria group bacterium]